MKKFEEMTLCVGGDAFKKWLFFGNPGAAVLWLSDPFLLRSAKK